MAHILFATVPIAGHVHPLVPVARRLAARGHEVSWYTGAAYADTARSAGANYVPYTNARDFDETTLERSFPRRSDHAGVAQLAFDLKHVFIAGAAGQLRDLTSLAATRPFALIIADPLMLGALLFKERTGTPLILVNVVAYPMRSRGFPPFGLGLLPRTGFWGALRDRALHALVTRLLFADVQRHWERARHGVGLSTVRSLFDACLEATWFVQPTIAALEYDRASWPDNVRLIGPLHRESGALPEHRDVLAQLPRPLVHVTQGTTSNATPTLFVPTLSGLAREPVGVLVATGGVERHELGIRHVPANARLVPFISYPALLPQTSVMITNGGYGGVQLALSHGVPLVIWGTTEDKPETAARVAWSGAGVRLGRGIPRPNEVRDAVREVLHDARYRKRAAELAREYARHDAPTALAELSEQTLRAISEASAPRQPSSRR